jgi:hypothetical protein
MKTVSTSLCVALFLVVTSGFAGNRKGVPVATPELPVNGPYTASVTPFDVRDLPPTVGTPTTLTGFYDWQSNGGQAPHILVNPSNGWIHVTYMYSPDSLNIGTSRTCGYALSTDGGATWNNFNNIRIPENRSSGYPVLGLGQGGLAGGIALANHSNTGGGLGNQTFVYVDIPEGGGAFAELAGLPPIAGSAQPIWPNIAIGGDGSINVHHSPNIAPEQNYLSRTTDYISWSPNLLYPGINDRGGRYPTRSTSTGLVGSLLQAVDEGTHYLESTNNGATWPASAVTIHPSAANGGRVAGVDTFQAWVGADFIYNGTTPLIVLDEVGVGANDPTESGYIAFWSQPTGWVEIARPQTTPGAILMRNIAQSNHFTMGWPTIGLSGSNIVVAWTVMQPETLNAFNFCDIYASMSSNGGATWTPPRNITNTPNMDERYASMSQWNQPGFVNLVWQVDPQPGSAAFTDNAPLTRAWQVYYKLDLSILTGVGEDGNVANNFRLSQNYPNPFNPATKIDYVVPVSGRVTITVYDVLGREVATVLNEDLEPGTYQAVFDGSSFSSGVYYYKMTAGAFSQTRKMMLVK